MGFHTFGDSHAKMPWERITGVICHHIGPVLCYSIGQEKLSRMSIKADVKDGDIACFCFGEIDCRVHIAKHVTPERSYEQVIDEIAKNYFIALMENEKLVPGVRMAVYNVVPPCSQLDSPVDPSYPYNGDDEQRKAYARYFNEAFARHCRDLGWVFVDVYSRYTNAQGFLDKKYSDGHVHITDPVFIEEFLRDHELL